LSILSLIKKKDSLQYFVVLLLFLLKRRVSLTKKSIIRDPLPHGIVGVLRPMPTRIQKRQRRREGNTREETTVK
jgi:hypothetical protein